MMIDEIPIRKAVREHYAELAEGKRRIRDSCCGPDSASVSAPREASEIYDGCGLPVEMAEIREGDVVVDFGSGGGYDAFRTSELVGKTGRVIGIDATPEMVWRARETAKKHDFSNVEFRLGEIEHVPVDSASVDVIISNCVINLAPDKSAVFQDAYRILKPGGRLVVSDTVSECTLKVDPKDLNAWAECSAGALPEDEYLSLIEKAGFVDVEAKAKTQSCCSQGIASITVTATKPGKT